MKEKNLNNEWEELKPWEVECVASIHSLQPFQYGKEEKSHEYEEHCRPNPNKFQTLT